MNKQAWSSSVSKAEAARRAGGRRRYNAERKRRMWRRRFAILRICATHGDLLWGAQKQLAERFGVHKCVISRDVAWAQGVGCPGSGFTLRCSYRRGAVSIEWINTTGEAAYDAARKLARVLKGLK